MVKANETTWFDIDKLKKKDPEELKRVAGLYANKKLTKKQVGLIAYNAKDALDAIQILAGEISKSQENAFKSNAHATQNAYEHANRARESSKTSEEKRDSDRFTENLHRESIQSTERMNSDNNSLWGKITAGVVALAAIGAYAVMKHNDSSK